MLELDHHCHWLGTCLGLRNYHSFYWYLVHIVLLSLFEVVFIGCYMWRLAENRIIKGEEKEYIFEWKEWIVLPGICLYVIGLGTWICKLCYFH